MKRMLLIQKIKVQNANALSSPYTIGFPAMTAWLGAGHALERKLKAGKHKKLNFKSMAVVCHNIDLQTHKGSGDYVYSIIGTGNPLVESTKRKKGEPWKKFVRPSFIEEARCHLTVSMVIECEDLGLINYDDFTQDVDHQLRGGMKLAGGDILGFSLVSIAEINDLSDLRKLTRQLMPGYCLIERRDLMQQSMEDGQDAIDALLDHFKIYHQCEQDDEEQISWTSHRKEPGWIVPIATGFHGITELGQAENQRDAEPSHRFAESVVTLGQFVMPYRINDLDNMLWHYHTDLKNNLYLCQQNKPTTEI